MWCYIYRTRSDTNQIFKRRLDMAGFTVNKLSEDDIKKAYRFIYIFEKEVCSKYGSFDFNSQDINEYCQRHRINKKVTRTTKPTDNYFWFDTKKIKGAKNSDFAHNFLRHIRNAMAHGNFKKLRSRKAYYTFEDYNKNNIQTMYGKISADSFWKYLNVILHSSPFVNNNINF